MTHPKNPNKNKKGEQTLPSFILVVSKKYFGKKKQLGRKSVL